MEETRFTEPLAAAISNRLKGLRLTCAHFDVNPDGAHVRCQRQRFSSELWVPKVWRQQPQFFAPLCRDHALVWQGDGEKMENLSDALEDLFRAWNASASTVLPLPSDDASLLGQAGSGAGAGAPGAAPGVLQPPADPPVVPTIVDEGSEEGSAPGRMTKRERKAARAAKQGG